MTTEAKSEHEPTWDAECRTCDAIMSDEYAQDDDHGPFRESDAQDWERDHVCYADVRLLTPGDIEKHREYMEKIRRQVEEMSGFKPGEASDLKK